MGSVRWLCVAGLPWEMSANLGPELGVLAAIHGNMRTQWKNADGLMARALLCAAWTGPVHTMLKEANVHLHNRVV